MIAVVGLLLGFLVSALFLIQGKRRRSNGDKERKSSNGNAPVKVVKPKSYSKSEVAVHNKRNDCWIIIKDKVYDVTSYVEEHPGGDAILDHAGDDSTDGFFGPQHATRVFDMIEDFYIGELQKQLLRSINSPKLQLSYDSRLAKKAEIRTIFLFGSEEISKHNVADLIHTVEYALSQLKQGKIPNNNTQY